MRELVVSVLPASSRPPSRLSNGHRAKFQKGANLIAIQVRAAIHRPSMSHECSSGEIAVEGSLGNSKLRRRCAQRDQVRHERTLASVRGIDGP